MTGGQLALMGLAFGGVVLLAKSAYASENRCSSDAGCSNLRLPAPVPCATASDGSTMVQTPRPCCRMGYCGICWSECGSLHSAGRLRP